MSLPETAEPQAILQPLDIQHDTDPADDHGPSRRIPHLGHAILFYSLVAFFSFACLALGVGLISRLAHVSAESSEHDFPTAMLAAQAVGYLATLFSAAWLFSHLWDKGFLRGIQWNFLPVRRNWLRLLSIGILMSIAVQTASRFIHVPDHSPIDELLSTTHSAWFAAAFGVLLAPLLEEVAFRGFLLPALATAYDWLALERTPAGLQRWQSSTLHSTSALVFAAVVSSIPFALLHAGQLSYAWGEVALLYGVSLVLSFVRLRTHSVACSTLVHATYNLFIFSMLCLSTGGFRHLDQFKP